MMVDGGMLEWVWLVMVLFHLKHHIYLLTSIS